MASKGDEPSVAHDTGHSGSDKEPLPIAQFHGFFSLPIETQLRILEYTDLVGPEMSVVWYTHGGFDLPPGFIIRTPVERDSWKPPTAFFLVSKSFRWRAIDIFWRKNDILVINTTSSRNRPSSQSRAAAYDFLEAQMSTGALPHIKTLSLDEIVLPYREVGRNTSEGSEDDWYLILRSAIGQGLNPNHIFVQIAIREEDLEHLGLRELTAGGIVPSDEAIILLRNFINANVWPLIRSEGKAATAPRFISITMDLGAKIVVYELRGGGERTLRPSGFSGACQEQRENLNYASLASN